RPRCLRAKSDAGSWPPRAMASAPAAPLSSKRQQRMQLRARKSRDKSPTLLLAFRLLAFRRGILDQIAGHRALLVEPFLRGVADLFGGDGANAIRPASDVLDAQTGGKRAAIPARQGRLIVLG